MPLAEVCWACVNWGYLGYVGALVALFVLLLPPYCRPFLARTEIRELSSTCCDVLTETLVGSMELLEPDPEHAPVLSALDGARILQVLRQKRRRFAPYLRSSFSRCFSATHT